MLDGTHVFVRATNTWYVLSTSCSSRALVISSFSHANADASERTAVDVVLDGFQCEGGMSRTGFVYTRSHASHVLAIQVLVKGGQMAMVVRFRRFIFALYFRKMCKHICKQTTDRRIRILPHSERTLCGFFFCLVLRGATVTNLSAPECTHSHSVAEFRDLIAIKFITLDK